MTCSSRPNNLLALVRLDDLGAHEPRTQNLIERLCAAGLRLACGIVPKWLSREFAASLRAVAAEFPGALEVHQHGYTHANHGRDRKYEFGAGRAAAVQQRELREGLAILQDAFSELTFPAFSPPYGYIGDGLVDLLRDNGYQAVSGLGGYWQDGPVPDFPIGIDAFTWDPICERAWTKVQRDWRRESSAADFLGLVLHPRFMAPTSVEIVAKALPLLLLEVRTSAFADLVASVPALRERGADRGPKVSRHGSS